MSAVSCPRWLLPRLAARTQWQAGLSVLTAAVGCAADAPGDADGAGLPDRLDPPSLTVTTADAAEPVVHVPPPQRWDAETPHIDSALPCAPAGSGAEFFMQCEDAGAPDAEAGAPDAGAPLDAEEPGEAGTLVEDSAAPLPDAAPEVPDEGFCAIQSDDCSIGRAEFVPGSATCSIFGQGLRVQREMCEVCGRDALISDYSVTVMDCNVCEYVYTRGQSATFWDDTFAAGECRMRDDTLNLTWTNAHPDCVDVYAYVGSAVRTGSSSVTQARDQVRICRCDRTTDTCISCIDGACDAL